MFHRWLPLQALRRFATFARLTFLFKQLLLIILLFFLRLLTYDFELIDQNNGQNEQVKEYRADYKREEGFFTRFFQVF